MSEATWLALAIVLTALGAGWTVLAHRRSGLPSSLRAAGCTLLVPAAYLTGTLELAGDIAVDVGHWARRLVFSPTVWLGLAVALVAVVLIGASGLLRSRAGEAPRAKPVTQPTTQPMTQPVTQPMTQDPQLPRRTQQSGPPAIDDDLADIEELLRRRGIS